MFASSAYSRAPLARLGAYQQLQVAGDLDGASPHRLVGMLFDGLADSVMHARSGMRSRNIAAKGRAITRAVRIVDEGLKASLNLAEGGELAANLNDLYAYLTLRLTQANLHNDEAALEECAALIEPLRSAWSQIAMQAAA